MTKVESKIEPNSMLDYFRRKSISFVHFGFIHPVIVADGQLSWQYPSHSNSPKVRLHIGACSGAIALLFQILLDRLDIIIH
jgi:hypothetical protein|tara:strand:- start:593 stop:835 length:243 start_codon:yes stop_codon:yes gene_type:complete